MKGLNDNYTNWVDTALPNPHRGCYITAARGVLSPRDRFPRGGAAR